MAQTFVSQALTETRKMEKHRNLSCFSICLLAVLMLAASPPCLADDDDDDDDKPSKISRIFKGVASFYGKKFHGRKTASGKPFDMNAFTCAHPSLPFGTPVLVQNEANGATCQVIVNDRGPFVGNRCIDLSKAAAKKLGITGVARVICKTGRHIGNALDSDKPKAKIASHATIHGKHVEHTH